MQASIHTLGMFEHLTDFGYVRTRKQALGFYIVYLLLTALCAAIIGAFVAFFIYEDAFDVGVKLGTIVGIIGSITLSFLILSAKKLTGNFWLLLFALIGGLLQTLGGGVISLIIPAYLTTLKKHKL